MPANTIVLISGANQGIGFEIVKKLATEQQDWHIVIGYSPQRLVRSSADDFLGSRDISKGTIAASSLSSLPSTVSAIPLDVTSDSSIAACTSTISRQHGRLDVLINNAGIGSSSLPSDPILRDRFAKCLDTNVYGAAAFTEACLPLLRLSSSTPRIVFISSEMGSISNALDPDFKYYNMAYLVEYKTSKAALNMLGATYTVRLGKEGFKVNMCCPGLRKTNFNKALNIGGKPEDGAINATRLALLGADGENGTFSNMDGMMQW
ncbi:MAG: hypothetical protein LQ351_004333 [Letrouitia transgressa]|nr:MAG: hypothetical protein LQ351_004333 [Letrouitia transgressa]